jgi:acetylornithine/succinyldiaminopimelate/putrescine aminotransferase
MWGLDLRVDAAPFVTAALGRGLLINRTAETVIRLLPPFVLTADQAREALRELDAIIGDVSRENAA